MNVQSIPWDENRILRGAIEFLKTKEAEIQSEERLGENAHFSREKLQKFYQRYFTKVAAITKATKELNDAAYALYSTHSSQRPSSRKAKKLLKITEASDMALAYFDSLVREKKTHLPFFCNSKKNLIRQMNALTIYLSLVTGGARLMDLSVSSYLTTPWKVCAVACGIVNTSFILHYLCTKSSAQASTTTLHQKFRESLEKSSET